VGNCSDKRKCKRKVSASGHGRGTTYIAVGDSVRGNFCETYLENLGHHAVHVLDIELAGVDDLAIWAYAAQNGSITPKTCWQRAEQPTAIS
jgi:hypothetical protein